MIDHKSLSTFSHKTTSSSQLKFDLSRLTANLFLKQPLNSQVFSLSILIRGEYERNCFRNLWSISLSCRFFLRDFLFSKCSTISSNDFHDLVGCEEFKLRSLVRDENAANFNWAWCGSMCERFPKTETRNFSSSQSYNFILLQITQQNQSKLGDLVVGGRHFVRIPFRVANELGREILIYAAYRVNQVDDQQKFLQNIHRFVCLLERSSRWFSFLLRRQDFINTFLKQQ